MIKRDTIQRIILHPIEDGAGGQTAEVEYKEVLTVNVSVGAIQTQVNQFGANISLALNVVSDVELDDYTNARYIYGGKRYKLMRQIKQNNEWFSLLHEVNE